MSDTENSRENSLERVKKDAKRRKKTVKSTEDSLKALEDVLTLKMPAGSQKHSSPKGKRKPKRDKPEVSSVELSSEEEMDTSNEDSGSGRKDSKNTNTSSDGATIDPIVFNSLIAALKTDEMKDFMVSAVANYVKEETKILKKKVNSLEKRLDEQDIVIEAMQGEINMSKQEKKNNILRIAGLPEIEVAEENEPAIPPEITMDRVKEFSHDQLGINIPKDAIYSTYRIGKLNTTPVVGGEKRRPRDILINFNSHKVKADMYGARIKLRNLLGMKNVYVNEDLTKTQIELLKETKKRINRDLKQTAWTLEGAVYVKLEAKATPVKVDNIKKLNEILKKD